MMCSSASPPIENRSPARRDPAGLEKTNERYSRKNCSKAVAVATIQSLGNAVLVRLRRSGDLRDSANSKAREIFAKASSNGVLILLSNGLVAAFGAEPDIQLVLPDIMENEPTLRAALTGRRAQS